MSRMKCFIIVFMECETSAEEKKFEAKSKSLF